MLVKGQRQVLEGDTLRIVLEGGAGEFVCFLLDAGNKVPDSNHVAAERKNGLRQILSFEGDGVQMTLSAVPASVQRIGVGFSSSLPLAASGKGVLRVQCGSFSDSYAFAPDFGQEQDAVFLEVYRKDGKWRFSVEAQGFPKGFNSLAEHYGAAGFPLPPASPVPPSPVPSPSRSLSLSKVTLEKRGEKKLLSLEKKEGQRIHINLNWDSGAPAGAKKGLLSSLFGGGSGDVDLDLGCMFELQDGQKGVIQPLGGYLGSGNEDPFIYLDKDDRSGGASDGENMYILKPEILRRVLVFAFIYEGTARFSDVNGRLTIKTSNEQITIRLDNPDAGKRFCAVGLFENRGHGLELSKEERYFDGHKPCDEHYGFGFNWIAGRK